MSTAFALVNNTLFGITKIGGQYIRTTEYFQIPYPIEVFTQMKISTLQEAKEVLSQVIETGEVVELDWTNVYLYEPVSYIEKQIYNNQYQAFAMFSLLTQKRFPDLQAFLDYLDTYFNGEFDTREFHSNIDLWQDELQYGSIEFEIHLNIPPTDARIFVTQLAGRKNLKIDFKCYQT